MMARCLALACTLPAACRYDTSLGVTRPVDAPFADASDPVWALAVTLPQKFPRDAHGVTPYDAWIVGDAGAMWRWNGQTLIDAATPHPDVAFDAVWMAKADLGYAVGARQGSTPELFQWSGAQWSTTASPADGALTGVWGVASASDARVWSVGHASNFLHRASSSTTWQRHAGPDLETTPSDTWVSGPGGDVWVAGGAGLARYRESDSMFVARFAGGALWGVHGSAADDVWAVGEQGAIRHWNGTAWSDTASGVTVTLRAVWASARDRAWAVGDGGTVLRWDGNAWHVDADFSPWNLHGIWGAPDGTALAVGSTATAGVVVRYGVTQLGL